MNREFRVMVGSIYEDLICQTDLEGLEAWNVAQLIAKSLWLMGCRLPATGVDQ